MVLFVCLFLETKSHYVAQAGLEFMILLPQSPECWDCKRESLCLALALVSFDEIPICDFLQTVYK
jgi:hypothetical protein